MLVAWDVLFSKHTHVLYWYLSLSEFLTSSVDIRCMMAAIQFNQLTGDLDKCGYVFLLHYFYLGPPLPSGHSPRWTAALGTSSSKSFLKLSLCGVHFATSSSDSQFRAKNGVVQYFPSNRERLWPKWSPGWFWNLRSEQSQQIIQGASWKEARVRTAWDKVILYYQKSNTF